MLNFYWMLVALVTGVYTFGLVGMLLGPMLIGLLKAIVDTITALQLASSRRRGDRTAPSNAPHDPVLQRLESRIPRTGTGARRRHVPHRHKGEFAFLTGPERRRQEHDPRLSYFEERPTSGEVRVSGVSSTEISRKTRVAKLRRRLGIVFQDFRLLDDRTAEHNVAFALEVIGTPPRPDRGRASARVLTQVGLALEVHGLSRASSQAASSSASPSRARS